MAEATSATMADQSAAGAGAHTFESRRVNDDIGQNEGYRNLTLRMAEIAVQDWQARLADERVAYKSFANVSQNGWNNLTDEEKRIMAQETRHNDIAIDRQWNVDEQGYQVAQILSKVASTGVLDDATLAALVKALVQSK